MNSLLRLFAAAFAALFITVLSAFAGDPTGTWKFTTEAAGRSVDSTLTLKWENDQLSGAIDNRAGKAEITNATFVNDQVTFTVERAIGRRLRKKKFTANYAGKLQGDIINGTIETTGRDKKRVSVSWSAQRVQ